MSSFTFLIFWCPWITCMCVCVCVLSVVCMFIFMCICMSALFNSFAICFALHWNEINTLYYQTKDVLVCVHLQEFMVVFERVCMWLLWLHVCIFVFIHQVWCAFFINTTYCQNIPSCSPNELNITQPFPFSCPELPPTNLQVHKPQRARKNPITVH